MSEVSGIRPPEAIKRPTPKELAHRVVDKLSQKKNAAKRTIIVGGTAATLMFTAACGEAPAAYQPDIGPATQATHAVAEGMRTASNYVESAGPPIDQKIEEIANSVPAREAQQRSNEVGAVVQKGTDQARKNLIEALGGTPKP